MTVFKEKNKNERANPQTQGLCKQQAVDIQANEPQSGCAAQK